MDANLRIVREACIQINIKNNIVTVITEYALVHNILVLFLRARKYAVGGKLAGVLLEEVG